MTFAKLKEIMEHHGIPEDVRLLSDSGWECDATEMDGVYYNKTRNVVVFRQESDVGDDEYPAERGWVVISEV